MIDQRRWRHAAIAVALIVLARTALAAPPAAGSRVDVAAHGKRTTLGTGSSALTVLYLKGTPYEMGYAHGALCREEVRYFARTVAPMMEAGLHYTPEKVDAVWALYARHMRPEYLEELRGVADGAGIDVKEVQRYTAIPDISEWHCTFFAATGPATRDHGLLQIRALDYETHAGIQKYPALIVCMPEKGVPFVNVGWLGHCGLVTGMNAAGIAMSEIGDDWDMATDNFDGRPLNYVMRDSVEFARSISEAVDLVKYGPRTTSLLYCLSSAADNEVRALETSHTQCKVFSPADLPFRTKPGLVYMSMGMDSAWNKKVGDWLLDTYGSLDVPAAERMMHDLHTGCLHAVVMRPATLDLWVANATASAGAYDQPFNHFNLKTALADSFFAN